MKEEQRMSNKYEKLVKNTSIIAIGSFGSKVLSFLIVPLYTYVLSTSEYGVIDLFTTTMSLIIPFSTLLMQEAVIRFLTAREYDEKVVINNSIIVFIFGNIISVIFVLAMKTLLPFKSYIIYFILFIIFGGFNRIFGELLRANGQIVQYSIFGVLGTASTIGLNLLFLLVFKMGMVGYFRALVASEIISSIYVTLVLDLRSKISFKSINLVALRTMLKYSIPLIPNNIMWWIMNSGDKYIINYFLGSEANGLYSLAMKIPTVISIMFSIFSQAWQLSAIEENNSDERASFYSNIYAAVSGFLFIVACCAMIMVRPVFKLVISDTFFEAYKYVPILCVATVLNCIATFCGITYVVNKESIKAFYTTLIGAVINLIFNFLLVKHLGLYGISIGTCIGYLVVMLIRMYDSNKEIGMHFRFPVTISGFVILIIYSVCAILIKGAYSYVVGTVCIIMTLMLYRNELTVILGKIMQRCKKVRKH